MATETELKLTFPAAALPRLRRHPLFRDATPVSSDRRLDNRYLDTPANRLACHQIALRLRRIGRDWVRTVKRASPATAGLSRRAEWETGCAPPRPRTGGRPGIDLPTLDFSDVDDAAVQRLLRRHAHHLQEVFATSFRREVRRCRPRPGVSILLMLDRGRITAGPRSEPIHELELELERGHAADLLALAARLAADLPLQPEDASKAERGYRLAGLAPRRPARRRAAVMPRQEDGGPPSALAAFQHTARRELDTWRALLHDPAAVPPPEIRHQVRVVSRRLRALSRLYASALPARFASDWRRRLRDQARLLGPARELEVLWTSVLQPALTGRRGRAARSLRDRAERARRTAVRASEAAFGPHAQTAAMLHLHGDLLRLRGGPAATAPAREVVGRGLHRLRRRVHRRLAAIDAAAHPAREAHALHRLRLAVKDLRDAASFADDLEDPRARHRRRRARLAALARDLGDLQDIGSARRVLRGWADADPRIAALIARIVADLEPRRRRLAARALRRARDL